MSKNSATPIQTLDKAKETAEKAGLHYIYVGNVADEENTYCHKCRKLLIRRYHYDVLENHLKQGKCPYCKTKIPGVF